MQNHQQNINKPNPTIYKKNQLMWIQESYHKDLDAKDGFWVSILSDKTLKASLSFNNNICIGQLWGINNKMHMEKLWKNVKFWTNSRGYDHTPYSVQKLLIYPNVCKCGAGSDILTDIFNSIDYFWR